MTPVAEHANLHTTSSTVTVATPPALVLHMGAYSMHAAEPIHERPGPEIDYESGASTFLATPMVEETDSSPVSVNSPFGI